MTKDTLILLIMPVSKGIKEVTYSWKIWGKQGGKAGWSPSDKFDDWEYLLLLLNAALKHDAENDRYECDNPQCKERIYAGENNANQTCEMCGKGKWQPQPLFDTGISIIIRGPNNSRDYVKKTPLYEWAHDPKKSVQCFWFDEFQANPAKILKRIEENKEWD